MQSLAAWVYRACVFCDGDVLKTARLLQDLTISFCRKISKCLTYGKSEYADAWAVAEYTGYVFDNLS